MVFNKFYKCCSLLIYSIILPVGIILLSSMLLIPLLLFNIQYYLTFLSKNKLGLMDV